MIKITLPKATNSPTVADDQQKGSAFRYKILTPREATAGINKKLDA